MKNNYHCQKCNSENTVIVSEPTEIEKKCSYTFLIFFFLFTLISIVGIIIIFKSLVQVMATDIETENYTETINAIVGYYSNLKKAQAGVYIGLFIFVIGFIPQIIMAMVHSLAPKYSVKNELKIVCLDCKYKKNYLEYAEQKEENEKKETQTDLSGN